MLEEELEARLKVVVGRQTWKEQESTDKTAPDRLGTLGLGNWENIGEVSGPAPFYIQEQGAGTCGTEDAYRGLHRPGLL